MFDKDGLKRFIAITLQKAFDNPELYDKNAVIDTILYRIDLVEEWKQ